MGLTLNLPAPIVDELTREAEREKLSTEDHAALLLCLATALLKNPHETPFRMAVKEFLSSRSIDTDLLASALKGILVVCTHPRKEFAFDTNPGAISPLLQDWRTVMVHPAPMELLTQASGRVKRPPVAKGKYGYLRLGSEEFSREKQDEIACEERNWK